MADPMRTVSFKLPKPIVDALSDLAHRRNASRSAIVREALASLAGPGRSVTATVDALIAPVAGPRDLSSNPKRLARYGK